MSDADEVRRLRDLLARWGGRDGSAKRLRDLLTTHPVTVELAEAERERVALFRERFNAANPELEVSWDEALLLALENGLEADEEAHGLFASMSGGVFRKDTRERVREDVR